MIQRAQCKVALLHINLQVLMKELVMQANKPAIIESTDGKYPPITAEDFVRESLRAIYVKSEAWVHRQGWFAVSCVEWKSRGACWMFNLLV